MNVVKFKPEDYAKSSCSTEFYKSVGLFDVIKAGVITNVHQMKINPKTYKEVDEKLCSNWKRNKVTKRLRQDKAQSMISFDWMNYSPVQDKTVSENEIWWEATNEKAADVQRSYWKRLV
jgi:hypothetical protein